MDTKWVPEANACKPHVDNPTPDHNPPCEWVPGADCTPLSAGGPPSDPGGCTDGLPQQPNVGDPISPLRGAKVETIDLGFALGGVPVTLSYDSLAGAVDTGHLPVGPLGPRWAFSLLRTWADNQSGFTRGDGSAITFDGALPTTGKRARFTENLKFQSPTVPRRAAVALTDLSTNLLEVYTYGTPGVLRSLASLDNTTHLDFEYSAFDTCTSAAGAYPPHNECSAPGACNAGDTCTRTVSDAFPVKDMLMSVTDARSGRKIRFGYTTVGTLPAKYPGQDPLDLDIRLTSVFDVAGREIRLLYATPAGVWPTAEDLLAHKVTAAPSPPMLSQITWPDGSTQSFHYDRPDIGWALTGVTDQNGDVSTTTYDAVGRATSTEYAGGLEKVRVEYAEAPARLQYWDNVQNGHIYRHFSVPSNTPTVYSPDGRANAWSTTDVLGTPRFTGQTQPAGSGCAAASQNQTFDDNGFVASRTDFNGNVTCFAHDTTRRLETARFEGIKASSDCNALRAASTIPAGSRVTSTQWHPVLDIPAVVTSPGERVTFVYNGDVDPTNVAAGPLFCNDHKAEGAWLCKKIEEATIDVDGHLGFGAVVDASVTPRVRSWRYDDDGRLLTETDPVGNTTSYAYFPDTTAEHTKGDLATVTDAMGLVTTYVTYAPSGKPLRMLDPNGIATDVSFDDLERLTSFTVAGATTKLAYWPTGLIKQVTPPTGAVQTYTYNAAHRLIQVSDAAGNHVDYTLDASGKRKVDEVHDASGALVRQTTRTFDVLGRLQRIIGR